MSDKNNVLLRSPFSERETMAGFQERFFLFLFSRILPKFSINIVRNEVLPFEVISVLSSWLEWE